jgi:integrase
VPTFKQAASAVHSEHKAGWKNGKHVAQWLSTLTTYVFPRFGGLPVAEITSAHVRDALAGIWLTKPETARRVRQRIGTVLDYAHGKGWREHPFSMSAVNKALPRQPRKTGRHEAMRWAEVPSFVSWLRERSSVSRLALEALILTAARSSEIRGARWQEVDLEAGTWMIPADRMKAGRPHVVPLSPQASAVFRRAVEFRTGATDLVFPGSKSGRPLSDMTLLQILRGKGLKATVHGFRSAFSDYVAEETSFPSEITEAALAHANPNKVEAAYRRTDYFEKRRALMAAWGAFCLRANATLEDLGENE